MARSMVQEGGWTQRMLLTLLPLELARRRVPVLRGLLPVQVLPRRVPVLRLLPARVVVQRGLQGAQCAPEDRVVVGTVERAGVR